MALLAGTAGAVAAAAIGVRSRTRPKAVSQTLTIRASRSRILEFFREAYGDRRVEVRDDVALWNGGGVYVREAPGGRGMEVYLTLHVGGSARSLKALTALRAFDPKSIVKDAIRDAKAQIETGEIPTGRYVNA